MATTTTATSTVTSTDGTAIAVTTVGSGPPVVLVDGALCHRAMGPNTALAEALSSRFTVHTYDRRGRGASGDTPPYAVEREIEDLAAVIAAAGGTVELYGISSGAALALEAANAGLGVRRLALYEAPYLVDDSGPARPDDYLAQMDALVAAGDRSGAVGLFLRSVGVPGVMLRVMRLTPVWSKLTSVAHTLPYDLRVLGDTQSGHPLPRDRWTQVRVPTLVMDGTKSPTSMRNAMRELADVLPAATYRSLPRQTHMLKAAAMAPVLTEFFGG